MRPEQRLDQIEPIIAEVLQKVDRLIDTQGLILNEVSKIPGIETKIAGMEVQVAKIAGIEVHVSKITGMEGKITNMEGKITNMEGKITNMEGKITNMEGKITSMEGRLDRIEINVDSTARAVAALTLDVRGMKSEMRTGFGEIKEIKISQEKMENTQQEILTLLRARP